MSLCFLVSGLLVDLACSNTIASNNAILNRFEVISQIVADNCFLAQLLSLGYSDLDCSCNCLRKLCLVFDDIVVDVL